MKKILSIVLALSVGFLSLHAQDARKRTVETIVSDVLAQMPASSADIFAQDMGDLAVSAPKSVELLAGMLQSPGKGANNLVEYALSGLVNYVSDPAHSGAKANVLAGLKNAEMVKPADAERLTGYVCGGISPFGQKRRTITLVSDRALVLTEMLVSGGQRGFSVGLPPDVLVKVLDAKTGDITDDQ